MALKLAEIRQKIKQKSSRFARTNGNPNESDIDRQLARAGKERTPEDIPKQDTKDRNGNVIPGNVTKGSYVPSTVDSKGKYRMGSPVRPHIVHDAGFSKFPKKKPSLSDYWDLFKWRSMLEGAETFRPDLTDGLAAYRHFLEGEGRSRTFSYDRYVMNDMSGRITLRNAILDAQYAAIKLWQNNGKPNDFNFTGPPIHCGTNSSKLPNLRKNFPYPLTENWQKTIGAHVIWLSGSVKVNIPSGTTNPPEFRMKMVLHAEDQYNFNPGAKDLATGIPDDANGRFVVVGFAHGYFHTAKLTRKLVWKGTDLGVASVGPNIKLREMQPQNNRAATNRI